MLKNATLAGIDPIKFWDYTPYELELLVNAYIAKEKEKYKDLIYLAWYTEAMARQKRLPKIEELLKEDREMSDEEMLKQVKELNSMLGGEIIGNSKKPDC